MVDLPARAQQSCARQQATLLLRVDIPVAGPTLRPFVAAGPYAAYRMGCTLQSSVSGRVVNPPPYVGSCDVGGGPYRRWDTGLALAGGLRFRVADRYWGVLDTRYDMGQRSLVYPHELFPVQNRSLIVTLGIARQ